MSASSRLQASANGRSVDTLRPFWSQVVGAGRANEGLRADWQRHLVQASSACGFRYVRFHGLYHDDMHVYHEVEGQPVYNFQYIDALCDALLDTNVRPFIEFGFCPSILATETGTVFWWNANGSPPKDLQKWGHLIHATVQHWVDRYGIDEVKTWYFECWNEPNLHPFFTGSRSDYYALYEVTVKAVKSIEPSLRVGGPSTSNFVPDTRFDDEWEDKEVQKKLADMEDIDSLDWRPVWLEHFLQWCHSRSLPVDFVSCHPYPTDWALDSKGGESRRVRRLNATPTDLRLVRDIVDASPYPSAEIHLTEWNSSPSSRDLSHDYVPAAVYIVRTMLASLGLVDTIAYWTFTDVFEELGAGMTPFHGGFGMINLQGIPKPTFHAFRLLNCLGDEILHQDTDGGVVTRNSKSGLVSAILFHYPAELKTSPPPTDGDQAAAEAIDKIGTPQARSLSVEGLVPGTKFQVERLAPGTRGDVVSAWKKLGSPATLTRDVERHLKEFASLDTAQLTVDDSGRLIFEEEMAPWTLLAFSQVEI